MRRFHEYTDETSGRPEVTAAGVQNILGQDEVFEMKRLHEICGMMP